MESMSCSRRFYAAPVSYFSFSETDRAPQKTPRGHELSKTTLINNNVIFKFTLFIGCLPHKITHLSKIPLGEARLRIYVIHFLRKNALQTTYENNPLFILHIFYIRKGVAMTLRKINFSRILIHSIGGNKACLAAMPPHGA